MRTLESEWPSIVELLYESPVDWHIGLLKSIRSYFLSSNINKSNWSVIGITMAVESVAISIPPPGGPGPIVPMRILESPITFL